MAHPGHLDRWSQRLVPEPSQAPGSEKMSSFVTSLVTTRYWRPCRTSPETSNQSIWPQHFLPHPHRNQPLGVPGSIAFLIGKVTSQMEPVRRNKLRPSVLNVWAPLPAPRQRVARLRGFRKTSAKKGNVVRRPASDQRCPPSKILSSAGTPF
jgi:hypothetical protein